MENERAPIATRAIEDEPAAIAPSQAPPEANPLYAGDGPLSAGQASHALEEFRETVIRNEMADWEPDRSILRDDMIETFVTQRLGDPEEWFRKVPQLQRAGTNPVEKNLFLARICEIVDRIVDIRASAMPAPATRVEPTPPVAARSSSRILSAQRPSPANLPTRGERPDARDDYVVADMTKLSVTPRPDRFHDLEYRATVIRMVTYVIQIEGPIYDDFLIARIARVHGFQKAGGAIQKLVRSAVDRRFPRSMEDGREVFWSPGAQTETPVPFRESADDVRSHADIPIAELASLALPFIRFLDDESILRKMTGHFGLSRLRESTRARFQKAILFARSALASGR